MPREAPPPLLSHGNGPRARPARRPSRGKKASPAPGGPSRCGQIRRTMRPPRGRPSCRAGDLAAGHKGARRARASGGGRGGRGGGGRLRPPGPRPRVSASPSAREPAEGGGGRKTKGGSAESGGRGCAGDVGGRAGRAGRPTTRRRAGRCPRCWRRGSPRGTGRVARRTKCARPECRLAARGLPGQLLRKRGREWNRV